MAVSVDKRLTEIHEAPKGGKFRIQVNPATLLYSIHMVSGGVRPMVTDGEFTSYRAAKKVLDLYFKANPKPEPRKKGVEDKTE